MLKTQERNCLISCSELELLIREGDPGLAVIAILPFWRHCLQRIPGSLQVTRRRLRDPRTHRLIGPLLFQRWARSLGIHTGSRLVIVDERYDATWLWWAFRRYGHSRVQVLDGGLPEWRRLGGPMDRGIPFPRSRHAAGTWTAARTVEFPVADQVQVLAAQHDSSIHLWDTREEEEWSGAKCLRGAARPGRIPWAHHLPWHVFRHNNSSRTTFQSNADVVQSLHDRRIHDGRAHIFYCQSGVRTTTVIFVLYRLGWPAALLLNYEGSWREWSACLGLPILLEHQKDHRS